MNLINKKFFVLIDKIFTYMLRVHNNMLRESYQRQMTIEKESFIHVPPLCPQIENLTGNPVKLRIGNGTHIRGTIFVYPYARGGVTIGNNSYLGENSIIRAGNTITIGNNVLIAHNVTIIDTDSHEIDSFERAESYKNLIKNGHPMEEPYSVENSPIIIKDYAWISYGVSILKGITIGEGAIIGCGSVVTHDIPDYCLAVGNPAKVIKSFDKDILKTNKYDTIKKDTKFY